MEYEKYLSIVKLHYVSIFIILLIGCLILSLKELFPIISNDAIDMITTNKTYSLSKGSHTITGFKQNIEVPLHSSRMINEFALNFDCKSISLNRTFQTRQKSSGIQLLRIDIGKPHTNPDGVKVGSPHIHVYNDDFFDKFAFDLPDEIFKNKDDYFDILITFMKMCCIKDCEKIFVKESLFV